MGLFDLFDDMKEKSSKRRQAEEYRRSAKKYVQDGERIYNNAYSEVSSYSYETSYKIEQHYSYKQRIVKEISGDVSPVLSRFNSFNIDRRVLEAPSIDTLSLSSISGKDLLGGFSASFAPSFPIPSIFDLFSDPEEEYWEARRQKDEAKRFYENMKYERDRLRNVKEKLRNIRYYMDDEKKLLDSLNMKLRNITTQLNTGMNKTSFTKDEADYLKGIHKIAMQISDLLTIKFLNENFTITDQYQLAFGKIKEINQALEETPSISSGNEGFKRLLDILGGSILK
jgi:hypothetical protein